MAAATERPIVLLTPEEEEHLVNLRLAMEDRQQVRRVIKRWQLHVNSENSHPETTEHFLLELESFQLAYRKNEIIVRAEERQVLEYQESKTRLEREVLQVLEEIERLKLSLEESQEHRRRKISYDEIASKINELPSRAEQEVQINTLLVEIAAIKEENDANDRIREERKQSLVELNRVLDQLRIVGKGAGAVVQDSDALVPEGDVEMEASQPTGMADGEMEEGEERDVDPGSSSVTGTQTSSKLNPLAPEFQPRGAAAALMRSRHLRDEYEGSTSTYGSPAAGSPAPAHSENKDDEDVEMGEVQSPAKKATSPRGNPTRTDELEEGEASDTGSSVLTSVGDE